ncbi:DegT/DnrJ/EryC1/StrS aminotransferase family protein [Streptococcus uberis]
MKYNIPFSPPDITELEILEVIDSLKSGWITTGPKTKEFEKKIANFCQTNQAVCLNSQTSCAEMTLRLLGVGPGDEVIVPAYTYTATASVVEHVGAKLIMIDCEKGKFTMDYKKLAQAITSKTKVIIPVDLFGIPCDYDALYKIVESKKHLFKPSDNPIQKSMGRIIIMADGAHALGATRHDKIVGTLADFTNFSFHAVKNLTTAEGGAVTWRAIKGLTDKEIYNQYMLLSLHGQNKDALSKSQIGSWEYDIVGTWYKCNMTDISASIGLAQLARYKDMLLKRKKIIQKYNEHLKHLPLKILEHYCESYNSSGHILILQILDFDETRRNEFINYMGNKGIATNVHYKPLPMHTAYKNLGFKIENYPNAFENYKNVVSLPLYSTLKEDEVDYIIDTVKGYFNV